MKTRYISEGYTIRETYDNLFIYVTKKSNNNEAITIIQIHCINNHTRSYIVFKAILRVEKMFLK